MDDEDREIISDFVAESLENLGSIEVQVMNLEQDPSDLETISWCWRQSCPVVYCWWPRWLMIRLCRGLANR